MAEQDETQRIEPVEPTRVLDPEPTARFDMPPPPPQRSAGYPGGSPEPGRTGAAPPGPPQRAAGEQPPAVSGWTPPPLGQAGLGQPPAGAPAWIGQQPLWPGGYPQAPSGYPPPGPAAGPQAPPGGYGTPGYPQPGYGQPGYPPPGYGPSGYAQSGYGPTTSGPTQSGYGPTPSGHPPYGYAGPYARYAQPNQAGYAPPPYNPYGQYHAGQLWPAPAPAKPRRRTGRTILVVALALALTITGFGWALRPLLEQSAAPTAPSVEPAPPSQDQPGGEPETPVDPDPNPRPSGGGAASESAGIVFVEGETSGGVAAGTGMVLTPDGKVLTNYHVVAGTQWLLVTIAETSESFPAKVLGFDQSKDVALLQLEDAHGLATITVDHDQVEIGDPVAAVGNARGESELVRAPGKVVRLDRSLTVNSDSPWGSQENLSGVIETTAGAVPGHSGGPMFDDEGEVLGMTTAGSTQAERSYAVPIADALDVVDTIEAGEDVGTVRVGPAGYLGIVIGEASRHGVTITDVVADSPAGRAGIQIGSTLVQVGDTLVEQTTNLATVIRGLEPGDQVTVRWLTPRGEERQATVTLTASPVN